MKKILFVTFFILSLTLLGCANTSDTENKNDNDNIQENKTTIDKIKEQRGQDPDFERFPDSVRTSHVHRSFTMYVAETSVDEVISFYEDLADAHSLPFEYEEIPEEFPHSITAYQDIHITSLGGFAVSLKEAEDICNGCVQWILYTSEWSS